MSRSPKYSQARLEERRRRELIQERQRRAALEAEQRREKEEEERKRRAIVAEHIARMKAERDARTNINNIQVRLFGVKSDDVIMTWCQSDVKDIEHKVAEMEKMFTSERWDSIDERTKQLNIEFTSIVSKAQDRQLKEEMRDYIQKGMCNTLSGMGFQVGVPNLMKIGNFDSDVVIRARRPDGKSLHIQVPVDGNISYRVDGFPMRKVESQGGKLLATCDEAQSMIESFHQYMRKEFGIEMGELQWEDKPPTLISKDYREIPDYGVNTHKLGG